MSTTITIALCEEDRKRLDAIETGLAKLCLHRCDSCAKSIAAYVANGCNGYPAEEETPEAPTAATEAPKPEVVEPAPQADETPAETTEPPEAPAKKVELSEVQQKVVALAAAGKKAEVKEIVNAYADKVSAIPEDKLAEVLDKLNALEV